MHSITIPVCHTFRSETALFGGPGQTAPVAPRCLRHWAHPKSDRPTMQSDTLVTVIQIQVLSYFITEILCKWINKLLLRYLHIVTAVLERDQHKTTFSMSCFSFDLCRASMNLNQTFISAPGTVVHYDCVYSGTPPNGYPSTADTYDITDNSESPDCPSVHFNT